jgi:hypothetical protein
MAGFEMTAIPLVWIKGGKPITAHELKVGTLYYFDPLTGVLSMAKKRKPKKAKKPKKAAKK